MKFCNGEVMGKKLQLSQVQQGGSSIKNKKNGHVCKSLLTADVAGESKVSFQELTIWMNR